MQTCGEQLVILLDVLVSLAHLSGRAEALSELLASIRRQGVRAENILKDGDNLLQRIRNLESRARSAQQEEFIRWKSQANETRTWIRGLSEPLGSAVSGAEVEEMKTKALVSE